MARIKDRELLDLSGANADDLLPRKGVLETSSLNKRRNRCLHLFRDGNAFLIAAPQIAVV